MTPSSSRSLKNSLTLVPNASRMSISVAMEGEVMSRSSWEMKPLVSSVRAASSSWVSPRRTRSRLILLPISMR